MDFRALPLLPAAAVMLATACAASYSPRSASLRNCAEQEATADGRSRCFQQVENASGDQAKCAEMRVVDGLEEYEPINLDRQTELVNEARYQRHEAWEAIANAPPVYDVDWGTTLVGDESRNATEWIRGALLGRGAVLTVGVTPSTRDLVGVSIDDKGMLKADFAGAASSGSMKEAVDALTVLHKELSAQPERLHTFFAGYYMALDNAQATNACYRQAADAEVRMVKDGAVLLQAIGKSRDELAARLEIKLAEESAEARDEAAAWQALKPAQCREAKTATDCDALEAFVARYPAGAHAEEAKAILTAVEGSIRVLRDEAAWKAAVGPCTSPKTSTDCDGAKKYVETYPSGNHADEAQRLLQRRRGMLAQLAAQEEAKRRAGVIRAQQECINQCTKALRSCQKDCSAGAPEAMPACQKSCLATFHQTCVAGCKK